MSQPVQMVELGANVEITADSFGCGRLDPRDDRVV